MTVTEKPGSTSFSASWSHVHVSPLRNAPGEAIVTTYGEAPLIAALVPLAVDHARAVGVRVTSKDTSALAYLCARAQDDVRSDRGALVELEVPKQIVRFCRIFIDNVPNSARLESTQFRSGNQAVVATWRGSRPQRLAFTALDTFTATLDDALRARLRARETQHITAVRFEEPADLDHGRLLTKGALAKALARGALTLAEADADAWTVRAAAHLMPTLVRAALAETEDGKHEAVVEAAQAVVALEGLSAADRSSSGVEQELAELMGSRRNGG